MTDHEKAAYVMANAVAASIEREAMIVANRERAERGLAPAYGEDQFRALIHRYGIHHNAMIKVFHEW